MSPRKEGYRSALTRAAADVNMLAARLFQESEENIATLTRLHNRAVETKTPISTQEVTTLLVKWSSELQANRQVIS